ncbi:MAG: hypothetical protein KBG41_03860 [Thiobacillaceae bacterium]|jgi:hypothetical protein|nr:hypothetical protein [Thiobacillaceae bacterium]
MTPRYGLLALALVVTAILAFLPAEEPEDEIVSPVRRAAEGRPAPAKAPTPAVDASPSEKPMFVPKAGADPFAAQSFRPPPPPPPRIVPPPPMAPPLPFGFVGMWTENGQDVVFLSQRDAVLSASKGQTLAGGWRLDDVQAGALLFTYMPMNQQKTLRIAP